MAIEELASLEAKFDGAISNFGALNCVADLGGSAKHCRDWFVRRQTRPVRHEPYLLERRRHACSAGRVTPSGAGSMSTIAAPVNRRANSRLISNASDRVSIGRGDHQL
jgi:hypothetical protein